MHFKAHLLIVSIIIVMIYGIIHIFMMNKSEPAATAILKERSPYNITVERASWGLNCNSPYNDKYNSNTQSEESRSVVKEDNVLYKVSIYCNGKPKCDIPISSDALGGDPAPSCGYKNLQIEYRCFSVDKLRKAKAIEGFLSIDCDRELGNP